MRTSFITRPTNLAAALTAVFAVMLFFAFAPPVLALSGNCPQIDGATGTACPTGQRFWGGTCHVTDLVCPNSGIAGDPRINPSCSAGTCSCPSGNYCGTVGQPNYNTCVTVTSCPAGQTFNVCTGTCVGDITAVIHDYVAVPQAAQGTASGSLRVVGNMQAADFCTAGGICLSTGGGGGWSTTASSDTQFAGHQIGIGTNPQDAALGPEYPVDIFADGNVSGVGDAAILRIVDAASGAGNLWTGTSLARYDSGTGTIGERWFIGMDDSGSDSLLFRSGGVNHMTIGTDGTVSVNEFRVPTGAVDGYVLTSDEQGNATWQAPAGGGVCSSTRRFVGVTTAGPYDGNRGGYKAADALCNAYNAGSKVCTAEEVLNSYKCSSGSDAIASAIGSAWINQGPPGFTAYSNDCDGWTSNAAGYFGRLWTFTWATGGKATVRECGVAPLQFACCE